MEEKMLLNKTLLLFSIACLFVLSGCHQVIKQSQLSTIKLGMTKKEVVSQLGEPAVYRGSMKNNQHQEIDVYEYLVYQSYWPPRDYREDPYWMYFCDDKLEQWCKSGDWGTTQQPDNVQEIRFR